MLLISYRERLLRGMLNSQPHFVLSCAYSTPPPSWLPLPPVGWVNTLGDNKKKEKLNLVNFVNNKMLDSRQSIEKIIRRAELLYLVQLKIQLRRNGYAI